MNKDDKTKEIVKKQYGKIAAQSSNCCGVFYCCEGKTDNEQIAKSLGYSEKEIKSVSESNLGLGCGNPTALGRIREGEIVLDLGSGAGFDCFLAAKKVGATGKVIGVDMTEEMIEKAETNAKKYDYANVQFILGDIESLPLENDSVDVIISNCVINLAPNKSKVFEEAKRVLKKNGRMYISDIVLLKDLSPEQKNDESLIAGCVGNALLKDSYVKLIKDAGFTVNILSEDKDISKRQYEGMPLESIKIEAVKN